LQEVGYFEFQQRREAVPPFAAGVRKGPGRSAGVIAEVKATPTQLRMYSTPA